ncbi:Bro-N domain-containing protein, partial [Phascolarctobacterium succinatutens]
MNNLQIFKSPDFGQVRIIQQNGEPWFIGKDVAEILGYKKPENAIAVHVDDEDKTTTLIQGTGSNYKSNAVIINESGLYSLILSSKMPKAKEFKRWVT